MTVTLQPDNDLFVTLHPSVDQVSWKCFNVEFELKYRKARGTAFQDLFRGIMKRAYPDEFSEVRPHGSFGDYKCDGYLRTTRTVFACYAPKSMRIRPGVALEKVEGDHSGALKHWKEFMSEWRLVHNDDDGLPPHLVQLLEQLRRVDTSIDVGQWTVENVRSVVQRLHRSDLVALFGPQPSLRDLLGLSHGDIKAVVDELAALIEHAGVSSDGSDVRAVPPTKMEFNKLCRATREFLQMGEQKSATVHQYFERQTDPMLASRISSNFQAKYVELRSQHKGPDDIFHELQIFAGYYQHPKRQMGALALLAYLFESCHIFERPPDDSSNEG